MMLNFYMTACSILSNFYKLYERNDKVHYVYRFCVVSPNFPARIELLLGLALIVW